MEWLEYLERRVWSGWGTWRGEYGVAGVPGEESMDWLEYLERRVWSGWSSIWPNSSPRSRDTPARDGEPAIFII
jgi:hypothetical protein